MKYPFVFIDESGPTSDEAGAQYLDSFNYWEYYIENIEWLCKHYIESDEICSLICDYCSTPKNSTDIDKRLTLHENIANVLRTESIGNPLIQLCDLLLGSTVFQFKELKSLNKDSNKVLVKREFVNFLSKSWNFENSKDFLTEDSVNENQRIKICIWKKIPKKDSIFKRIL